MSNQTKFQVYYSTSANGPWTLSNTVPISNNINGNNSYTITGLKTNVSYFVIIVGGTEKDGKFFPLIGQHIGPNSNGSGELGAINPEMISVRTFTPEVNTVKLLPHQFDISSINIDNFLAHQFGINGLVNISILPQQFDISTIAVDSFVPQQFDIQAIIIDSPVSQQFNITSIDVNPAIGSQFNMLGITATNLLKQQFDISSIVLFRENFSNNGPTAWNTNEWWRNPIDPNTNLSFSSALFNTNETIESFETGWP